MQILESIKKINKTYVNISPKKYLCIKFTSTMHLIKLCVKCHHIKIHKYNKNILSVGLGVSDARPHPHSDPA